MIAQEIVRVVQRSDISEEVTRMRAHLAHWDALTDADEPCGRKLEFLLQEMNREVNTIGSKADGLAGLRAHHQREGGAREDARAGSECRVAPPRGLLLHRVRRPSGTGKTTLVERLVQTVPNLCLSRSYTSRRGAAGRAGRG